MKRVLSFLLALCLITGAVPVFAGAAGDVTLSSDSGYDAGRLIIHNVQSQQTVKLYGEGTPLFDVAPGELFTRYFDYPASVMTHNCGYCGTVVSLCEARLINGELRSNRDPQYSAEPSLEADLLVWNSPEAASAATWGPGQVKDDHYTFSSNSVGKIYCVLVQYEDDSNGHLGDTTHFAVRVTKPKAPTVAGFNDVYEDDYYADAVRWAVENGITSGTGKNTFSPGQICTRAEIVTFLWRAMGSPKASGGSFADVPAGSYYEDAVRWAVANNITSGTGDGKFNPNGQCSRAQAVTFLWRANGSPRSSGSSFGDVPSGEYYADAVRWAVENNITSGTSGTTFSPNNKCPRGQIVTFLYRDQN